MRLVKFRCPECQFEKVVNLDTDAPPTCLRHSLHWNRLDAFAGITMAPVPVDEPDDEDDTTRVAER